jgi:transposase
VQFGVEISEQLDIIPQQVRGIQHQRVKYACPCCEKGIKVSLAPARIIPKGPLTDSALAWVVTSKYQDALPLYRQAALLGRSDGDLSRNTLAASIVRVGEAIQPIINLLRDHLLDADLVLGDETTVQVLKEPGRPAETEFILFNCSCHPSHIQSFGRVSARSAMDLRTLLGTLAAKTIRAAETALIMTVVALLGFAALVLSHEESAMAAVVRAVQPPIFQSNLVGGNSSR